MIMCILNQIQQLQAEKEALDTQIFKLEQLQSKTESITAALHQLIEEYRQIAPEELAGLIGQILHTCNNLDYFQGFNVGIGHKTISTVDDDPLGIRESVEAEFCNDDDGDDDECELPISIQVKPQSPVSLQTLRFLAKELCSQNLEFALETCYTISQIRECYDFLIDLVGENAIRVPRTGKSAMAIATVRMLEEAEKAEKAITEVEATEIIEHLEHREKEAIAPEYELLTGNDASELSEAQCEELLDNEQQMRLNLISKFSNGSYDKSVLSESDAEEIVDYFVNQPENKPEAWLKEKIAPELEKLHQEALTENEPQEATLTDEEYEAAAELEYLEKLKSPSEVVADLIESILCSHGFFMPDLKLEDCYDLGQKYEDYKDWAIYYSQPDKRGAVDGIGLYNESSGFWDAATEMIGDDDPTFSECFTNYDAIVAWTRKVIDEVVAITLAKNLEVPGQLALEFSEATEEQIEEEVAPKLTNLQKILVGSADFTFGELHARVAVVSVFTKILQVEQALFTVMDFRGNQKEYYCDAEALVYKCSHSGNTVKSEAEKFVQQFKKLVEKNQASEISELAKLQPEVKYVPDFQQGDCVIWHDLPAIVQDIRFNDEYNDFDYCLTSDDDTRPWTKWTTGRNISDLHLHIRAVMQPEPAKPETETEFEAMGYMVKVYPQLPMGVTFRFLNADKTLAFSNSLTTPEIADCTWKVCAYNLIQNYRDKEAARLEKEANPYKKPEDDFVEFVKIGNTIGYLKRKDNGKILAAYAAFSNRTPKGKKTATMAKSRADKWAKWLSGTFQIKCDAPRVSKRMISDNLRQPFAYEIKFKGLTMWQMEKLAQEDFSLLPDEMEEKRQNEELLRSEVKATVESFNQDNRGDRLSEEELSRDSVPSTFAGLRLGEGCGLNEDEIELVEMARVAIIECDSEVVKSINSVFREVCEKNAANRVKVWNALTENQQQTYKLLLQMEFTKAADFSEQTPEYIVYLDSKMATSIWLSLRAIDGKSARVWRHKGQQDETGYLSKEAAAIAAIQQLEIW